MFLECISLDPRPFFGIQSAADADVGKQVEWDGVKGEGGQSRATCDLQYKVHTCLHLPWRDEAE